MSSSKRSLEAPPPADDVGDDMTVTSSKADKDGPTAKRAKAEALSNDEVAEAASPGN